MVKNPWGFLLDGYRALGRLKGGAMQEEMPKSRILVIDDEPDVKSAVRGRLEMAGYEVAVAHGGKGGLCKLREFQPDLVVLDAMTGDIGEYEVCAAIKAEFKELPVILLTIRSDNFHEQLGFACKADSYIRKPQVSFLLLPEVEKQLSRIHSLWTDSAS